MTLLVDLNVILDVVQRREPHYTDSAVLLSKIVEGNVDGAVPGHAITTVYYLVRSYVSMERAETTVDWLLDHLEIIPAGENDFRTAFGRLVSLRWMISRMRSSLHWPIARPVTSSPHGTRQISIVLLCRQNRQKCCWKIYRTRDPSSV